ncbi:hypothetical protein ABM90_04095 [Rhodococcus erythropolis]|nr:hypothetical protein ABM90_04095 [Rhodococcus erythropolis]
MPHGYPSQSEPATPTTCSSPPQPSSRPAPHRSTSAATGQHRPRRHPTNSAPRPTAKTDATGSHRGPPASESGAPKSPCAHELEQPTSDPQPTTDATDSQAPSCAHATTNATPETPPSPTPPSDHQASEPTRHQPTADPDSASTNQRPPSTEHDAEPY